MPDLGSQMVCNAIRSVSSAYKAELSKHPRKHNTDPLKRIVFKNPSIHLDKNTVTYHSDLTAATVYTVLGRVKVDLCPGEFQKRLLQQGKLKESNLVYRKNKKGGFWSLHITLEFESTLGALTKELRKEEVIGVDVGENNIAAISTGQLWKAGQIKFKRDKYLGLRARLQRNGSQSARQHLRKASGRERRHVKHINHVVSKSIVQEAVKRKAKLVVLENLTHIRERIKCGKRVRSRLHRWSFRELQQQIDNIESTHPGYDEYRYDLDSIGHNPHELASYLTALLQTYTPQSAQAELNRVFAMQYTLTLTEETEIRYRTETSTDPETGETTTEEVPYEYHILNVKLTNKPISEIAEELLTPQQLEMYRVYLETSGNKPLIFGGGSPDMGASEDLSGVQLVNGTRPGNTAVVDLAKRQVGNVGGRPFWSWYGFNSRVEWCACFVSWCYNQAGKSEPRFAGCQSQGVPWFQSRGQWGARGYENIAPGDAIFFDWDLDGSADHVGIVIGTDGSRVYTVEGNSGDACKIKSYDLSYQCIKGYGLMNW